PVRGRLGHRLGARDLVTGLAHARRLGRRAEVQAMIRIRFDDGTEFDTDGRVLWHGAARNPYHTLQVPPDSGTFERLLVVRPGTPPAALTRKAGTHKEVTVTWPEGARTLRQVYTGWQKNPPIFWIEESPG